MTDLLDDLIAFFEARNTGNATNELLKRCKKEKHKQLLIHGVVKCVLCKKPTEKPTINYCDTCLDDYQGIE